MDETSRLQAEWLANVAAPLSAHVHPAGFEAGQLRLAAETPAWANRVRMQQTTILKQLRRRPFFRQLRGLQIRVQPLGSAALRPTSTPGSATRKSRLSRRAAALVRDVAGGIDDPKLREALERLADTSAGTRKLPHK